MIQDDSSDAGTSDSTSSDAGSSDGTPSDAGVPGGVSSDDGTSESTSSDDASSDGGSSDAPSSDSASSSASTGGGWSDAAAGGWNSGERSVGNVRRIPLQGLTQINQSPAPNPATSESAAGRAVLYLTASLDATQPIEVLLHLHGHNIGLRQRVASSLPDAGSVHDVLMDQIADQLSASGRPMIAILPQGTLTSGFSNGTSPLDCNAVISEVLSAAVAAGVWQSVPAISRVVLSAHSGGGGSVAVMASQAGQPHLPSPLAALFLFEAINGSNELASDTAFVTSKLNADLQSLRALTSASDQSDYLRSSFRFRGIYNIQDDFYATNYATINQSIAAWFSRNAAALGGTGSDTYGALVANYQIVRPSPFVQHDGIVGQNNLAQALAMLR